ncbi:MAG: hypothetical protein FIA99_18285 [Ruminiclostridium sp.]|nr:hypothetical protein [Ruminiclostridium sp.]
MNRTKSIAACIIVLLLAASAAIYFSMNANNTEKKKDIAALEDESTATVPDDTLRQGNDAAGSVTGSAETELVQTPEPLETEEIKILSNSPEYDLKMTLAEDSEKKTVLKLEYYYDGTGMESTLDSMVIPEIDGLFEKRGNASNDSNYRIEAAYLNVGLARAYFIVNGDGSTDSIQSDMYVVSLADSGVKKIFSSRGKYGAMFFSKDYKYLGYSYNDPPTSSVLQESSLLEVIDCNTDEFIIRNSRTVNDKKIGSNMKAGAVYDYSFVAWYSNNTVKLKQKPVLDEKAAEVEVLYDISRDLILDKSGNVINTEIPKDAGEPEKLPAESTSLKVLKDFYTYLGSENDYPKAMELLDETFSIKLEIFKQFGISELTKSEISEENASLYSDMLKAARFDAIVKEDSKDGTTEIYYYQTMELSPENIVRQPMSALLK